MGRAPSPDVAPGSDLAPPPRVAARFWRIGDTHLSLTPCLAAPSGRPGTWRPVVRLGRRARAGA